MFQPNTIVNGRYLILNEIARGGMGIIYLAKDQQFDDEIALKVSSLDERGKQAFENEAKLLSKLRHTGLPQVRGYFFEGKAQCLVMEFIEGENLHQRIETVYKQNNRGLSLTEIFPIIEQLCGIVSYLHSQNPSVIHRDIKPENIKQMNNGQIILLDFGMAKSMQTQLAGGTPAFASVEQLMGMPTNCQSDIYSVGSTIYNLLSGVIPTPATLRFNGLVDNTDDALKPLSQLNLNLPPKVSEVVSWAMRFRPEDRPASIDEFWKAFEEACLAKDLDSIANEYQIPVQTFQSSIPTKVLTIPKQVETETLPILISPVGVTEQFIETTPSIPIAGETLSETKEGIVNNQLQNLTQQKNRLPMLIGIGAILLVLFLSVSGAATLWKFGFFSKPKIENENKLGEEEKSEITVPKTTPTQTAPIAETKNKFEISMYLKQGDSSKKVGNDYIFKADNQAKYQGDLMYFGILPNKDGVLYVIWHDFVGNYLSLIYPTKRFPTSREILKANKEMRYPPVQEIGFDKVQTAERAYNADRIYFIIAPNSEIELLKELQSQLPEEKEVSLNDPKIKGLLEKLESLAEQSSVGKQTMSDNLPIEISSSNEVMVGFVELKSAKK